MVLGALLSFLVLSARAEEPLSRINTSASLGGLVLSGNLNQIQLNFNGLMSYSEPRYGNDLIVSGYRIYMKVPELDQYVRIGDDLQINDLPNLYLNEKVYLIGLAHYDSSLLHQVDSRWLGGAGLGYAPVRSSQYLIRAAVGGFYEHTSYPSASFNLDVAHDGNVRTVPRVGILSNGWFNRPNRTMSYRYVAWYFLNPLDAQDRRTYFDGSTTIKIKKALGLRLGLSYAGSTVVVQGVQTSDLRLTAGINVSKKSK